MRVQISGTKEHSSGRETVSVDLPSLTQNETLIASNPYDTRMWRKTFPPAKSSEEKDRAKRKKEKKRKRWKQYLSCLIREVSHWKPLKKKRNGGSGTHPEWLVSRTVSCCATSDTTEMAKTMMPLSGRFSTLADARGSTCGYRLWCFWKLQSG